ncbi:zona pellucida sperm-binding protein 3b [Genypterus blacodes]|uniref:zona pellucida sperm-binding protein 3b n=1 Tax=Genypterus blacodes TaxID=154954 RepID=UPI003F769807
MDPLHLRQSTFPWRLVAFLLAVCTVAESGSGYDFEAYQTTPSRFDTVVDLSEPPRRAVEVRCHADSMQVLMQADMFDTGLPVEARHLRLGSDDSGAWSECGAEPSGEAEFTIWTHLMACGTKRSSTEEAIIYSNVLIYSPEPSSDGVLRLDGATIPVECHYEKRYAVDGMSLHPAWNPFLSTATAKDQIDFNLLIMTDDWQFERGSHVYFLGDPIHLEVSVTVGKHTPLRVYVDHCFATATPDTKAALRYDFIEHHGCLADAYMTSSSSRFLPRVEGHKLRFQLDAFRFYQEPSNRIYITCYLKAVPSLLPVCSKNRACSFMENRWQSIDGNDETCRSCDVSQRLEEPLTTETPKTTTVSTSPPAITQDNTVHKPANYIRIRPHMSQRPPYQPQVSSRRMKRGADYRAGEDRWCHCWILFLLNPCFQYTIHNNISP